MTEIITLTISKELRDKIDLTRGDVPRSRFISRSLEAFFRDRTQSEDIKSKVLHKEVAASNRTDCEICTDIIHTKAQNSTGYCKCKCHKNKSQVSEGFGGTFPHTTGSSSFHEESQND
jgi:hypothetical protein